MVKIKLDESLKWIWSSIASMYTNGAGDRQGLSEKKQSKRNPSGYSSHSVAFKIYNKRTECIEERVHEIVNEANNLGDKFARDDEAEVWECSEVPDEAIKISNGKVDLMCQVKKDGEEFKFTITPYKAEHWVDDGATIPGTFDVGIEEHEKVIEKVAEKEIHCTRGWGNIDRPGSSVQQEKNSPMLENTSISDERPGSHRVPKITPLGEISESKELVVFNQSKKFNDEDSEKLNDTDESLNLSQRKCVLRKRDQPVKKIWVLVDKVEVSQTEKADLVKNVGMEEEEAEVILLRKKSKKRKLKEVESEKMAEKEIEPRERGPGAKSQSTQKRKRTPSKSKKSTSVRKEPGSSSRRQNVKLSESERKEILKPKHLTDKLKCILCFDDCQTDEETKRDLICDLLSLYIVQSAATTVKMELVNNQVPHILLDGRIAYNNWYHIRKAVEKNYKAKKILVCGIGSDEYNRVSACSTAKEIWKALQTSHEETTQQGKSSSEAKDLNTLTVDELIGNLKTYETKMTMKKGEKDEVKKERSLALKVAREDSSGDEFECRRPDYFVKKCPQNKQDSYNRTAKRNQVLDRKFRRKKVVDKLVKQALVALRDSSSESKNEDENGDTSMVVIENEASKYESVFALMTKFDTDDDDESDENEEYNFFEVKKNLKAYSQKKLISLSSVSIDAYHALIAEKNVLTHKINDSELERDNLLVFIGEVKEQINETNQLNIMLESQRRRDIEASFKVKSEASKSHLQLENEIKRAKPNITTEIEKNEQLKEDLTRIKFDLDKYLKWTWSSNVITSMCKSKGNGREGLGFEKAPHNPNNKYVTTAENWLCNHCG
ncbi:uncharacterized protein LOC132609018 [Lycium barbarum]|uniref:uncharacterized protein LOC132609018 n=1 Tax=Lycium barbarum TaxID=112863 RepID=UPI00293F72DE|nr:uncharacterized protein LOC132609018 [Lycium barbarum]